MTIPTTDVCGTCGHGQPDPLARARASVLPSPADHAEMPKRMIGRRLVRTCSCGKPWPCEQSRWAALRAEIQQERAHHDLAAAEFAERGNVMEEARRYARVNALDEVLATMDRMTASDRESAVMAAREREQQ